MIDQYRYVVEHQIRQDMKDTGSGISREVSNKNLKQRENTSLALSNECQTSGVMFIYMSLHLEEEDSSDDAMQQI